MNTAQPSWPALHQQLQAAETDLAAAAAMVGIDGKALLPMLPGHSALLTGRSVPVLQPRYRGACSVRFYVNHDSYGRPWPFIRFFTFKDGGKHADFHGLHWLRRQRGQPGNWSPPARTVAKRHTALCHEQTQHQQRQRFTALSKQFALAAKITVQHPWLQQRFGRLAAQLPLSRLSMRVHGNQIMLPIETIAGDMVGFHCIHTQRKHDNKRHYVKQAGALKQAFVRVQPVAGLRFYPLLFCEGVATALSLALVWPGEIRAVLSAGNYAGCRDHVQERVYFAHDQDIYKTAIGNVGLNHALRAARAGDWMLTPQFLPIHRPQKPTDFHDMVCLYGPEVLLNVLENPWCYQGGHSQVCQHSSKQKFGDTGRTLANNPGVRP